MVSRRSAEAAVVLVKDGRLILALQTLVAAQAVGVTQMPLEETQEIHTPAAGAEIPAAIPTAVAATPGMAHQKHRANRRHQVAATQARTPEAGAAGAETPATSMASEITVR